MQVPDRSSGSHRLFIEDMDVLLSVGPAVGRDRDVKDRSVLHTHVRSPYWRVASGQPRLLVTCPHSTSSVTVDQVAVMRVA